MACISIYFIPCCFFLFLFLSGGIDRELGPVTVSFFVLYSAWHACLKVAPERGYSWADAGSLPFVFVSPVEVSRDIK